MKRIRIAWYHFHGKHLQKRKLHFISWFDEKYPGKYCWADCVAWSFNTSAFNPFKIDSSRACEIESETIECGSCYCGGWNQGKCWDLLSKEERKAILAEKELIAMQQVDNFPF